MYAQYIYVIYESPDHACLKLAIPLSMLSSPFSCHFSSHMEKNSLLQFPVVSGLEMKILQSIEKDLSPCHTYTEVGFDT